MATIGERLRALREGRDVSQAELARRLAPQLRTKSKKKGSQAWVSTRETGEADVSVEEAELIAKALGYTGAFIIVEGDRGDIVQAIGNAPAADVTLAIRMLRALPKLSEDERRMFVQMVEAAFERAEEQMTPPPRAPLSNIRQRRD